MRKTFVLVPLLLLGSACTTSFDSSGGPAKAQSDASASTSTVKSGLQLTAERDVPMQIGKSGSEGHLRRIHGRSPVFHEAPGGYPGPVAKVRSGETVGFVIVGVDVDATFDVSARDLRTRLPARGPISLK